LSTASAAFRHQILLHAITLKALMLAGMERAREGAELRKRETPEPPTLAPALPEVLFWLQVIPKSFYIISKLVLLLFHCC